MAALTLALTLLAAPIAQAKRVNPRVETARTLNRGLAGTPMARTGWKLEAAAYRYRVSPYFIAAIAGVESSYGAAHCSQSRYWVFGLGSCGRSWTPPVFRTWGHTYMYFAKFLRDRWLSRGITSATAIGYTFCPPCGARWGAKIAEHLAARGWPPGVIYP